MLLIMFGLVVAKFQFPCRSPYSQLNVLKGIFGRLPGWREAWSLWDVSSLPPGDWELGAILPLLQCLGVYSSLGLLPLVDGPQVVSAVGGDDGVCFTAFQETSWG